MTPEEFQNRFYALVENIEPEGKGYVEAFKAKGDAALIFSDLSEKADDEFYIDDLLNLMRAFGVATPAVKKHWYWQAYPDNVYVLREFTLGELKAVVRAGNWPADAWTAEPVKLWKKLPNLLVLVCFGLAILGWLLCKAWPVLWLPTSLLLLSFFVFGFLHICIPPAIMIGALIKKAFTKPAVP